MTKASVLFWKKGYSETSMKDIAKACGFQPANIYNFFANKEDILYQILLDEMNQILDAIKHLEHDSGEDAAVQLRQLIEGHLVQTLGAKRSSMLLFDMALGNLSLNNRRKIIALRDKYDTIAGKVIERGIEQKIFKKVDVKLTVFCIASMIARSRIWFSPKGRSTIQEVVDFIYNFSLNGLVVP